LINIFAGGKKLQYLLFQRRDFEGNSQEERKKKMGFCNKMEKKREEIYKNIGFKS